MKIAIVAAPGEVEAAKVFLESDILPAILPQREYGIKVEGPDGMWTIYRAGNIMLHIRISTNSLEAAAWLARP